MLDMKIREAHNKGCKLMKVKTDALYFSSDPQFETSNERGGLKLISNDELALSLSKKNCKTTKKDKPFVRPAKDSRRSWTMINPDDVIEFVNDGNNVMIQGRGGYGKTYLAEHNFITERTLVLAPTNIFNKALTVYKNVPKKQKKTLHKAFHIGFNKTNEKKIKIDRKILLHFDRFIIDEVSMIDPCCFGHISALYREGKQIIITGDFNQLPPVGYEDYEMSEILFYKEICNYNLCTLTKNYRSSDMDDYFQEILDTGDVEDIEQFSITFEEAIKSDKHIAFTNKKRHEINIIKMNEHSKDKPFLALKKYGDTETISLEQRVEKSTVTPHMKIFVDLPVITHRSYTKNKQTVPKNELGVVQSFTDNSIIIDFKECGEIVDITPELFNKFFDCGYCITAHKSQGDTITVEYVIHQWKYVANFGDKFSKAWRYVALSRTISKSNVHIIL